MLNTMATSLFSRSHKRISLVLLLAFLLLPNSRGATLINDGTTTDGLARMANAVNFWEEITGIPATTSLAVDPSGSLVADQVERAWPAMRTVWFSAESAPTNGVYRVAADFQPAQIQSVCRGGVMGWLNTGRSNGIVLQVMPYGDRASFQVATVDFLAEDANVNESATNLFNPVDYSPATAEFGSSWSELGANYVATNFATFELTFTAPTAADTNVLSNVTARVTAKVFQVDTSGITNQVSTPIELLTDLPLPESEAHALGYFAVFASDSDSGVIGYLDNLVADNVGTRPNTPPSVQITNPATGAVFAELATITLEADAEDSDGSVRRVEFFADATSLGTVTNAPFSLSWTDVAAKNYALTARATDNRGGASTSAVVQITVNAAPTVSITSPAESASFPAPATITLVADAQDLDGLVQMVEFFADAISLGAVTNAPFSLTWTNVAAGNYALTARATDDRGGSRTSAVVQISVNARPTVRLTSPPENASFPAPATVTLVADARDPDGSVRMVEFFANAVSLGAVTNTPFSLTWTNVAVGNYALTARATDDRGGVSTSAVVHITVNVLPTVRLTNPAENASFLAPATIVLAVEARDPDGSVSSVGYFRDGMLLGMVTNAPFSLTWSNIPAGQYSLTARATDNRSMTATSAPVHITVTQLPGTGPRLTMSRTPSGILLAWGTNSYQLQVATNLTSGTWANYRGDIGEQDTTGLTQIMIPYGTGIQFFRLVGAGTPTGPALTIILANGQITLSWPADVTGYQLQAKADLNTETWDTLTNSSNPYSVPAASGNRFFRLVKP